MCRPAGMLADVTGSDAENGCHVGTLSEIPTNDNEAEFIYNLSLYNTVPTCQIQLKFQYTRSSHILVLRSRPGVASVLQHLSSRVSFSVTSDDDISSFICPLNYGILF